MAIKVSSAEYAEFKRLTQKANRRIKAHQKEYEKAGVKIIPRELTSHLGDIQHKSQYKAGELTPLSRGLNQFNSKKEFDKRIKELKNVVDNKNSAKYMPTVKEYAAINREKLKTALNTASIEVTNEMNKNINKMNTFDISKFWKRFTDRAVRKGMQYSSDAVFDEVVDATNDLKSYIGVADKLSRIRRN